MELPPQRKMIGWYNPGQLILTAVNVVISTIFGRHADYRLIEAMETPHINIQDYSTNHVNETFWIDYVADVGDGWNSTYAIAYYLSQPTLRLEDPAGNQYETKRGSLLIFGGDAVYPVASRAQYKERLVAPYVTALGTTGAPHPDLYIIPGNHDWYDSLASYTRLFCSQRWFAGWQTKQERSYFALKLPHHWWLIGTDIQLDSDIDDSQVKFFKNVAKEMQDNDKVILCVAEPEWIYAKMYGIADPEFSENNLAFLENVVFQKKISIYLAGDLHHYRRHETIDGSQKITAGGGGAFLHPTHGGDVSELAGGFSLKKSFPDTNTSQKLCWQNFAFLFINPFFGFITGLLYLLTVWSAKTDLSKFSLGEYKIAMATVFNSILKSPIGLFWVVAILIVFFCFY